MDIQRQRCASCGSIQHENLLVRQDGLPTRVFVRCARCRGLVARYVAASEYHEGQAFDAYLRGLAQVDDESGREALGEVQAEQAESRDEFRRLLEQLDADRGPADPEEPAGPR